MRGLFFERAWNTPQEVVKKVLSHTEFCSGKDLTKIQGLTELVEYYLQEMDKKDIKEVINSIIIG